MHEPDPFTGDPVRVNNRAQELQAEPRDLRLDQLDVECELSVSSTPPVQCRSRLPALRLERLGSCIWLWRAGDLEGLQDALRWLKMRFRIRTLQLPMTRVSFFDTDVGQTGLSLLHFTQSLFSVESII